MKKHICILVVGLLILICSCNETTKTQSKKISENHIADNVDNGRYVFKQNCASCHHLLKNSTGPALIDIMKVRNEEWLNDFLTKDDFKKDSLSMQLEKEYGYLCMRPTHLRKEEIAFLYKYLTSSPEGCFRR